MIPAVFEVDDLLFDPVELLIPPFTPCRFHPERPGVGAFRGGLAHPGGHLPLPGAAMFRLVGGCLSADRATGSDQTGPQDDSGQEQKCECECEHSEVHHGSPTSSKHPNI